MCLTTMILPMSWGLSVCKVTFICGIFESLFEGSGLHVVPCGMTCGRITVYGSEYEDIPAPEDMIISPAATLW